MRIAFFDTHSYEWPHFEKLSREFNHEINFIQSRLTIDTAILAAGFPAVCVFVNDQVNESVLQILSEGGTRILALRCTGFNQVDLEAAKKLKIKVVRMPGYSPYSVAEHAITMIMALNRKIHRAYNRVKEEDYSLNGLVGFDLHGKTVGVVGTGKVGSVMAKILLGFGCDVLANDLRPNKELKKLGIKYVELDELLKASSVVTLHVPLTPNSKRMINADTLGLMHPGTILINTGRGSIIDIVALLQALKTGQLGGIGLDVYEEEDEVFFREPSGEVLPDDQLSRLLTFPNVILTSHQGYLTKDTLLEIAETTLRSISDFENGRELKYEVALPTN